MLLPKEFSFEFVTIITEFEFVTIITGVFSRTRRRSELSNFKMAVQQQLFNP